MLLKVSGAATPSEVGEAPMRTNSNRRKPNLSRGSVGRNGSARAGTYGLTTVVGYPASVSGAGPAGGCGGCAGRGVGVGAAASGGGGAGGTVIRVPSRRETLGSSIDSSVAGGGVCARALAAAPSVVTKMASAAALNAAVVISP